MLKSLCMLTSNGVMSSSIRRHIVIQRYDLLLVDDREGNTIMVLAGHQETWAV